MRDESAFSLSLCTYPRIQTRSCWRYKKKKNTSMNSWKNYVKSEYFDSTRHKSACHQQNSKIPKENDDETTFLSLTFTLMSLNVCREKFLNFFRQQLKSWICLNLFTNLRVKYGDNGFCRRSIYDMSQNFPLSSICR